MCAGSDATQQITGGSPIHAFNIDLVSRDGAVYLEVDGELDLASAPVLEERICAAEASPARLVVINMAHVPFIDSTGLRVLLAATARSRKDGDRLRITGAGVQAQRLFKLAGVFDKLPFVSPTGE